MCQNLHIPHTILNFGEERSIDLDTLDLFLAKSDKIYTHVSVIHSETTSGVLNKIDLIGQTIKSYLPGNTLLCLIKNIFFSSPNLEKTSLFKK